MHRIIVMEGNGRLWNSVLAYALTHSASAYIMSVSAPSELLQRITNVVESKGKPYFSIWTRCCSRHGRRIVYCPVSFPINRAVCLCPVGKEARELLTVNVNDVNGCTARLLQFHICRTIASSIYHYVALTKLRNAKTENSPALNGWLLC